MITHKKNTERAGKFLALILRHKPEIANITLDENGYAYIPDVIAALDTLSTMGNTPVAITLDDLAYIVLSDDKGRFSFGHNNTKIRANNGHSLPIDLSLPSIVPPELLYHGTACHSVQAIRKNGLVPMGRQFVHLSIDKNTAAAVGRRHGIARVLIVEASRMNKSNYEFFRSDNGVWLTRFVPPEFLLLRSNFHYRMSASYSNLHTPAEKE